jgi:hypothetical protein
MKIKRKRKETELHFHDCKQIKLAVFEHSNNTSYFFTASKELPKICWDRLFVDMSSTFWIMYTVFKFITLINSHKQAYVIFKMVSAVHQKNIFMYLSETFLWISFSFPDLKRHVTL